DTTEGEWCRLGREVKRPLGLGVHLLPLVPTRRWHDATALLEWLTIGRGGHNSIRPRIDRGVGPLPELIPLEPKGNETPTSQDKLAPITGWTDDRHNVRGSHVVARLEGVWRIVGKR